MTSPVSAVYSDTADRCMVELLIPDGKCKGRNGSLHTGTWDNVMNN